MNYAYGAIYKSKTTGWLVEIVDIIRNKDKSIDGFWLVDSMKNKELQEAECWYVTKEYFDKNYEEC
jgi:hypothetical protein